MEILWKNVENSVGKVGICGVFVYDFVMIL